MQYGEKFNAWRDAERAANEAQRALFAKVCRHPRAAATPEEVARINELRSRATVLIREVLAEMQAAVAEIRARRGP